MIPERTLRILDSANYRKFERTADFALTGEQLNELLALVLRMNWAMNDAYELRDWQNLLNFIVSSATQV